MPFLHIIVPIEIALNSVKYCRASDHEIKYMRN